MKMTMTMITLFARMGRLRYHSTVRLLHFLLDLLEQLAYYTEKNNVATIQT